MNCPICFELYDKQKYKPIIFINCQHTVCSKCQEHFGFSPFYLDFYESKFINQNDERYNYQDYLEITKKKRIENCKFATCPFCQNPIIFKMLNHSLLILIMKKSLECNNSKCGDIIDENFYIKYFDEEHTEIYCNFFCSGLKACSPNKIPNCISHCYSNGLKEANILNQIYHDNYLKTCKNSKKIRICKRTKKNRNNKFSQVNFNNNYSLKSFILENTVKVSDEKFDIELIFPHLIDDNKKISSAITKQLKRIKTWKNSSRREYEMNKSAKISFLDEIKLNALFYRFLERDLKTALEYRPNDITTANFTNRSQLLKELKNFNKNVTNNLNGISEQYQDYIKFKIDQIERKLNSQKLIDFDKDLNDKLNYFKNLKFPPLKFFDKLNLCFNYSQNLYWQFLNFENHNQLKPFSIENKSIKSTQNIVSTNVEFCPNNQIKKSSPVLPIDLQIQQINKEVLDASPPLQENFECINKEEPFQVNQKQNQTKIFDFFEKDNNQNFVENTSESFLKNNKIPKSSQEENLFCAFFNEENESSDDDEDDFLINKASIFK